MKLERSMLRVWNFAPVGLAPEDAILALMILEGLWFAFRMVSQFNTVSLPGDQDAEKLTILECTQKWPRLSAGSMV